MLQKGSIAVLLLKSGLISAIAKRLINNSLDLLQKECSDVAMIHQLGAVELAKKRSAVVGRREHRLPSSPSEDVVTIQHPKLQRQSSLPP